MFIEILLLIGVYKLFTSKKNTVKTEIKETPTKLIKGTPQKTEVVQLQTKSGLDVSVPTNNFVLPPKEDNLQFVDIGQSESKVLASGIQSIKNLDLGFIK